MIRKHTVAFILIALFLSCTPHKESKYGSSRNPERIKYNMPIIEEGMQLVRQDAEMEIWDSKFRNAQEANHFRKTIWVFGELAPGHRAELDLFTKVLNDTTYECLSLYSYYYPDTAILKKTPHYYHLDSKLVDNSLYDWYRENIQGLFSEKNDSEFTGYDYKKRALTTEAFDSLLYTWGIDRIPKQ